MQQNDNDCTHKNYDSYFLLNILIVPKEKKGQVLSHENAKLSRLSAKKVITSETFCNATTTLKIEEKS